MIRENKDEHDLAEKATAAFKETVQIVVGQARQTHTPIIVWQDGAVVAIPVETFEEPDPIDPSLPAIIRGFWQGGKTFNINTISGALATQLTPLEMLKEQSITNVHTILYWIDKNNPLAERLSFIIISAWAKVAPL